MALKFNRDVTIYSNGPVREESSVQQALRIALASHAKLDSRTIKRLVNDGVGPDRGITIEFEVGPSVTLGMLLHKPPVRNRAQHLIDQLELKTKDGSGEIIVDPMFGETSVSGCLAAGDTSKLVKQVALAMGSGKLPPPEVKSTAPADKPFRRQSWRSRVHAALHRRRSSGA